MYIHSEKFHPAGSPSNLEFAQTNYTSGPGSINSPQGRKFRSTSVQGFNSGSRQRTCKSRYSHQLLTNFDTIPDAVMEPPYVNKIGPGEHSFISTFDANKIYHVNRYVN
jgi:hypothetical protein